MALYYDGDLDKDIKELEQYQVEFQAAIALDLLGKQIGYGRAQQILQILWARSLKNQGLPTSGALFR